MFALQELLDLVKMSGCSLIVWLKDKVVLQVTWCIATAVLVIHNFHEKLQLM